MQQTTMLAIFAIALALGLTTAMLVVPMMPQVFADSDQKLRACNLPAEVKVHIPFCIK